MIYLPALLFQSLRAVGKHNRPFRLLLKNLTSILRLASTILYGYQYRFKLAIMY